MQSGREGRRGASGGSIGGVNGRWCRNGADRSHTHRWQGGCGRAVPCRAVQRSCERGHPRHASHTRNVRYVQALQMPPLAATRIVARHSLPHSAHVSAAPSALATCTRNSFAPNSARSRRSSTPSQDPTPPPTTPHTASRPCLSSHRSRYPFHSPPIPPPIMPHPPCWEKRPLTYTKTVHIFDDGTVTRATRGRTMRSSRDVRTWIPRPSPSGF